MILLETPELDFGGIHCEFRGSPACFHFCWTVSQLLP